MFRTERRQKKLSFRDLPLQGLEDPGPGTGATPCSFDLTASHKS